MKALGFIFASLVCFSVSAFAEPETLSVNGESIVGVLAGTSIATSTPSADGVIIKAGAVACKMTMIITIGGSIFPIEACAGYKMKTGSLTDEERVVRAYARSLVQAHVPILNSNGKMALNVSSVTCTGPNEQPVHTDRGETKYPDFKCDVVTDYAPGAAAPAL